MKKNWLIFLAALALAFILVNEFTLSGDDKIVFDIVVDAAREFDYPETIQLTGGRLSVDKDCLWATIEHDTYRGYRVEEEVFISDTGYVLKKWSEYCSETDNFNIPKINKALKRYLKKYE